MADQAKITSLDALEAFRAHMIVFLNKAHTRLDEVGDEVRRTRSWIQTDQRLYWEGQIRRRRKILEAAEQELMTARLSSLRDNLTRQMIAVRRAKESLTEAEEKLRKVKAWARDFETAIEPLSKKLESLRGVLNHELPKSIAYLLQTQRILEGYTETPMPVIAAAPAPPEQEEPQP